MMVTTCTTVLYIQTTPIYSVTIPILAFLILQAGLHLIAVLQGTHKRIMEEYLMEDLCTLFRNQMPKFFDSILKQVSLLYQVGLCTMHPLQMDWSLMDMDLQFLMGLLSTCVLSWEMELSLDITQD